MDYVLVFLLGVACAFAPAALWAAAQRRPAAATPSQPQPSAPIIVLPPAPQPVTNHYTYNEIYNDNRRMVADEPQRAPVVELPRRRQFKVVGEREEWLQ